MFVGLIAVCCALTVLLLARAASFELPFSDDWLMVPIVTGRIPLTLGWLWEQHYEHRIAIPKLVFVQVVRWAQGDVRPLTYINIGLCFALSIGSIAVARAIRGRARWVDMFFPLLLLGPSQLAFKWAFEFTFTFATFLIVGISLMLLRYGRSWTTTASAVTGLFLLCVPLSGSSGLLFMPIITVWLLGRTLIGGRPRHLDRPTLILLGSVGVSMALSAWYVVTTHSVPHPWSDFKISHIVSAILQIYSAGFGHLVEVGWPGLGLAVVLLVAGSFAHVVRIARDRRYSDASRLHAADLAAFMIAFVPVSLAVVYGRAGESWLFKDHYQTLSMPIILWSFLGFSIGAPGPRLRLLPAGLAVFAGLLFVLYTGHRIAEIDVVSGRTNAVIAALRDGMDSQAIADTFTPTLYWEDSSLIRTLVCEGLRDLRTAQYRLYPPSTPVDHCRP